MSFPWIDAFAEPTGYVGMAWPDLDDLGRTSTTLTVWPSSVIVCPCGNPECMSTRTCVSSWSTNRNSSTRPSTIAHRRSPNRSDIVPQRFEP